MQPRSLSGMNGAISLARNRPNDQPCRYAAAAAASSLLVRGSVDLGTALLEAWATAPASGTLKRGRIQEASELPSGEAMTTNDDFGFGKQYDEVGMREDRWGDPIGVVKVEPPKPPPRWLLKLQAIVRRRERARAQSQ
jgi:hypothetical protein